MALFCSKCGTKNQDEDKVCSNCNSPLCFQRGPLPEGTVLENRYKILSLLKTGGMGAVYKAKDTRLNSICAVKELLSPYGDKKKEKRAEQWFFREAEILAGLDHASLPKVFDYFANHNRYYLVMNFIEGEDLDTILKREGNPGLPQEKVASWAEQILGVLSYLHSRKPPIIYRDIKPSNIMVHKDGRVILVDFGIARAIKQDSDTQKTAIGTMGYVPEEQCMGQPEPRSDIYALGATMHHLLTGENPVPFRFEPVSKFNKKVSSDLEKIVMKSLKHEVSHRFSSADDMREKLISIKETSKKPGLIRRIFSKRSLPYLIPFFIFIIIIAATGSYLVSIWTASPWIPVKIDTNKGLTGIQFTDEKNGWVTGEEGTILHTSDGGKTWKKQLTGISAELDGVYFSDSLHGWTVGKKWKVGQCVGITLYTEDGGKNWKKEYKEIPKGFKRVYILDINNAWASGNNGTLYHITDRGKKWDKIDTGIIDDIYGVRFIDSDTGWLSTSEQEGEYDTMSVLLHTKDGGKNWESHPTGLLSGILGVEFINYRQGWISGVEELENAKSINGLIKYTEDGGKTWHIKYREKWFFPYSIYFIDENKGYVLGTRPKGLFGLGATLLRTGDGGKTWKEENYPYLFCTRFFFFNPEQGWACGSGGSLLKYSPENFNK